MKNLLIIFTCVTIASCATKPTPKVNTLTDENSEVKVTPPKCPDWTSGGNAFNPQLNSSFYGCSTVNNFGKMIDDPMDMLSGKSSEYYDGQTSANAVAANRSAPAQ